MNEEYYTIAHASKFVQPGAVRIQSGSIDDMLETVAFLNPDGSKALIALNPTGSAQSFRIVENGQFFSYQLAGKSVTTFVWGITPADFNDDGQLDIGDLDRLMTEVSGGSHRSLFDLTQDGIVDLEDIRQWLADAGAANLPSGNPYLFADANLDGVVDGQDFIVWNGSKFSSSGRWSEGEFNGDGVVDGQDFILWNGNKFTSSDHLSTVPEPGTWTIPFVTLLSLSAVRRALTRKSSACAACDGVL